MELPLPLLPSPLLEPLKCGLATCRYKEQPLPSTESLSIAMSYRFWRRMDNSQRSSKLSDILLDHFETHPPKEELRADVAAIRKLDRIESLRGRDQDRQVMCLKFDRLYEGYRHNESLGTVLRTHYALYFRGVISSMVEAIEALWHDRNAGEREEMCHHELIPLLEAWIDAGQLPASLELRSDSLAHDRADWTATQVKDGWKARHPTVWKYERDFGIPKGPHDEETIGDLVNGRCNAFATSNLFLGGLRLLLNHITSPLAIVAHLLQTNLRSTADSILNSPLLRDLVRYNIPTEQFHRLRLRVAIRTAPSLWKPHPSTLQPLQNVESLFLLKGTIPSRSNPSQQSHSNFILFPNIVRFDSYHECSPIVCFKNPIVANYDQAEYLLGRLVDLYLTKTALATSDPLLNKHRADVLLLFFAQITSFDCESEEDRTRLFALLETAFVRMVVVASSSVARSHSGHLVNALSTVHTQLEYAERPEQHGPLAMCMCDLTRICPSLEKNVADATSMLNNELKKQPVLPPIDRKELKRTIADHIRAGSIRGSIWSGEWKAGVSKVLKVVRKPLDAMMLRDENRVAHIAGYRHLLAAIGPSRLHEEILFTPPLADPPIRLTRLYALDTIVAAQIVSCLGTDAAYDRQRDGVLVTAIDQSTAFVHFSAASCLDASYWPARLNVAAVRLQQSYYAFSPQQLFQVVHHCTVVLHYAGANFKAYYRRGVAELQLGFLLAALADFEQALLLDPISPVVIACIDLARGYLKGGAPGAPPAPCRCGHAH